jgi:hypothetical protein
MNLIDVHKTFATDEQWRLCAASVRRAREPRACASPKRKRSRSTRGGGRVFSETLAATRR